MRGKLANANVFLIAVAGSLVLLNLVSLRTFARFDLTKEGMYTLSKASKDTMASLEDAVTVSAYFTGELPPPYSSNARYVRDLLEEFRAASKGKLSFEFIDPMSQETEKDKEAKREMKRDIFGRVFREPTSVEKELSSLGVQPVEIRVVEDDQMQTKRAYMGLVIRHQEQREVIPVVQSVSGLEYDLTSLIRKLTRTKTPVIGILQGHEGPKLEEKLGRLHTVLSQTYAVRPVDLAGKDKVEDDIDALWVIGPKTALQANELRAIDQFLMNGKGAAFFLDSLQVSLRNFETAQPEHGLTGLLSSYGVTVGDKLVADVQSAQLNVEERRGFMVVSMPVPFPFIPMLQRLEGDSPISKGLGGVTMPFVTVVSAAASEGRQSSVLARSSPRSWLESKPFNVDPRRDWRSETITTNGPYDLMVQVSGKLRSHFAAEATTSGSASQPVLAESQGEARLLVVGGSSFLWDEFLSRPNQALAANIADWLLLDPALLAMRNRGLSGAPLKPEVSDGTRNGVKFGNALGVPLALVGFGLLRWRMREGRRARARSQLDVQPKP
ncbi:MAG: GldG family protein [Myxococcales bacterium]|nr:GldG family protein [Myxococcales bacterium]